MAVELVAMQPAFRVRPKEVGYTIETIAGLSHRYQGLSVNYTTE